MSVLDRYHDALMKIPAPGKGLGCHASLLGISNLGLLAGKKPNSIFDDIRANIPQGLREVYDREIMDAVSRALADHRGGSFTPKPKPIVEDGKNALQKIIIQSNISDEVDLWELSPIRIWEEAQDDPLLLLRTLYEETDLVFIGERYESGILGDTIRPVSEWLTYFKNGGKTAPFIILNPLTGKPAQKGSRMCETHRGNGNIAQYRFCIVEFDNLSREDQFHFWTAIKLPIMALIDSGGKSIHAWLDVQRLAPVSTLEEWETSIKNRLYDRILTPLGVDSACSNPARLSRLPGHFRDETGRYQRLLWLSPEGRSISC